MGVAAGALSSLTAPSGAYAQIDELLWEHWCLRIRQQGLGSETLGHCVARLHDLPRSLWFVPVQDFLFLPYGELLRLRGFGMGLCVLILWVTNAIIAFVIGRWHQFAKSGFRRSPLDGWPLQWRVFAA